MQYFKLKDFSKWAKKERIKDVDLLQTIHEMDRGLLGDRLGGFVFKKRLGLSGRGKRGGARTIIMYKTPEFALFLYGYAKNEKSDLTADELEQLRIFARKFLKFTIQEREQFEKQGKIIMIHKEGR